MVTVARSAGAGALVLCLIAGGGVSHLRRGYAIGRRCGGARSLSTLRVLSGLKVLTGSLRVRASLSPDRLVTRAAAQAARTLARRKPGPADHEDLSNRSRRGASH